MAAAKTPSVPALERGLAVLELVAKSRGGLTFSQLARSLDYPPSSIHCLLLTLHRQGYLSRSSVNGRYFCGMKLVRVASAALDGFNLRDKAAPILRDLCKRTGLTVHLAVRERGEAMLIAKVSSVAGQHVPTWIGKRIDVHCTSVGKCLIAFLPETEIDDLVREHGLLRYNENTISSVKKLKQELELTRTRGYAVDDQEEEIGMCCVGTPVFDQDGRVIAAVSVSGTSAEIDVRNCRELVNALQQTCSAISAHTIDTFGAAKTEGADASEGAA